MPPAQRESVTAAARSLASFAALAALHLTACNAIFGIRPGETDASTSSTGGSTSASSGATSGTGGSSTGGSSTGTGGSSTGGSSTGTGGSCGVYDGTGTVTWTDLGGASLPTLQFGTPNSVRSTYYPSTDITVFSAAGTPGGDVCIGGAEVTLSGPPIEGQVYTVVDLETSLDSDAFHSTPSALVAGYGRLAPPSDNCDREPPTPYHAFESMAGVGQVKVISVTGTHVSIEAGGIVATPDPDPQYLGEGTLGVALTATSDCHVIAD